MMRTVYFAALSKYVVVGIGILLVLLANSSIVADQRPADCTGICDLAWSPAEEHLLGAVDERGLWLYDANESDSAPQFFSHKYSMSLSFDPQGQYIAVTSCPSFAGSTDPCKGELSLFDLQEHTWKQLGLFDYSIENAKFSTDGKYVAFQEDKPRSAGIQLIDLANNETFSLVDRDRNRTSLVIDYAFDPQSNYIAISNGNVAYELDDFLGISVWRLSDQTLLASTRSSIFAANLIFTESDNNIMFVQYDTQVSIWNYRTGTISPLKRMTETPFDNLHNLSFSNPPNYLLASLLNNGFPDDRTLFAWDIHSGKQMFSRRFPENSFMDLIATTQTGDYIAYSSTVDESKLVGIWDRSNDSTHQVQMIR